MNNEQLMFARKARDFYYFSPTPTEWAGGVCEAVETLFQPARKPARLLHYYFVQNSAK